MPTTRTGRLMATVPVVASALVVGAVGSPRVTESAAGESAQRQRAADPCEKRWPPSSTAERDRNRGLGRPAPSNRPAAKPQGRPNILTIMVDDMRADELRGPWMKNTRALIGQRGANFRNSFAPYPLCGPARSSFLTGKYSHNHGVRENSDPSAFKRFNDTNTVATWLNGDGAKRNYNTAFLGKYLNGYSKAKYVPPGWNHWYASLGKTSQQARNTKLSRNGKGVIDLSGQFQTSAYGNRARKLISKLSGKRKPFSMVLSFSAPHAGGPREPDDPKDVRTPARLPKNRHLYENRIVRPRGVQGEPCNDDKPAAVRDLTRIDRGMQRQIVELRQQRAQSLKTVDRQIPKVINALRRSGELANTYVIFTSDNGFFLGEFRQRVGKRLLYEPALRTPTLVRGPGIPHGARPRAPFTSIDFAPTIAAMANVRKQGSVDGVSMLAAAKRGHAKWRRAILTDAGPYGLDEWFGRGVRVPGFSYGRYRDVLAPEELFDLGTDPNENHNVVRRQKYGEDVRRLRAAYRALQDCDGKECRRVHP